MLTTEAAATIEPRPAIPAVFAIERRPAPFTSTEPPRHVADHISTLLRGQLADLTGDEAHAAEAVPAQAADRRVVEWRRTQVPPMRALDLVVPVGSRIITPPYDHDWATGAAWGFPRFDGDMLLFGSDGFSADGVSIMLSSAAPMLVSVSPQGTYDFSWASLENLPNLRSRGGLGVLVYRNGVPEPLVQRQAVLWTLNGVAQYTGNKGSGQFGDAVAAMTAFGPIPLAPVLFDMSPGDTYEVWMWCWTVGQNESGHAFLNAFECRIPAVLIEAGPPIVIH